MWRCVVAPRVAAAAALVMLAGCVSQLLPDAPMQPRSYDFGPPPESDLVALPRAVRLAAVETPSWLDGLDIYYRRLDEQPGALRAYAQSQWIAPTPELLARRLRHRLVQAAPDERRDDLMLSLEVLSFEQQFVQPDEAYATVRARARLQGADGTSRERELAFRRTTTADVRGATRDLPRVVDDLIDAILEWLRTAAP